MEKPSEGDLEAREDFFEAEPHLHFEPDSEADDMEDKTSSTTTRKPRTGTRKTRGPAPILLAAAAVRSTRAINRAKRQSAGQVAKSSTNRPI